MAKNYLDKEGLAYLWSKIKNYIKDKDIRTATPVGGSIDWYGPESTIPSDWMREDGRSLSKTQYPELFAIIGYTYGGSGDNFNIPNSKGRVNVHLDESDNDFKVLGNKYGWKEHQLTVAQMPSHRHSFGERLIVWDTGNNNNKSNITQGNSYTNNLVKFTGFGYEIGSTGNNEAHPNVQPSIVSYKIIKVKEDAASRDLRLLDDKVKNYGEVTNMALDFPSDCGLTVFETANGTYSGITVKNGWCHIQACVLQGANVITKDTTIAYVPKPAVIDAPNWQFAGWEAHYASTVKPLIVYVNADGRLTVRSGTPSLKFFINISYPIKEE